MKLLRVLETHVVGDVHFIKGKLVEATHPLVVGLEHFYEEVRADITHDVAEELPVVQEKAKDAAKAVEGEVAAAIPVVEKQVEAAAAAAVKSAAAEAVG